MSILLLLSNISTALAEGGYSDSGGCEFSPGGCLCLATFGIIASLAAAVRG